MPYPMRLPRPRTASSLPCLLAAIGVAMSLAACDAAMPHRIDPNATAPAEDPKNIARAMVQPKPAAPAPVPPKAAAAAPAASSIAAAPARSVAAGTPRPTAAAAPPATAAAPPRPAAAPPAATAPPVAATAEPAKAASVAPPSTSAATSQSPDTTALKPQAASTPQTVAARTHSGILAMMAADSTVLATRIGDQKTGRVSTGSANLPDKAAPPAANPQLLDKPASAVAAAARPGPDKSAPAAAIPAAPATTRPAALAAAPLPGGSSDKTAPNTPAKSAVATGSGKPAMAATTLKPANSPTQPVKADTTTPGKSATDSAASSAPADMKNTTVAATAAARDNSATQAEAPQPPVVMVTSADDIRIPPTSTPAPPIPSSASVPAQGSARAPSSPPATAKVEPPPAAARKPAAETHKAAAAAVSKPAVANAAAGGTEAPPGDPNALYGMPLPNLPSLQDQSGGAPPAATQVARADTPADAAPQPDHTAELVQVELKKAQNRISLSDAQLEKLQAAQDHLASGDSGGAFIMLQALNAELQSETRSYVVQDNESMWHVAGQQEVYGNSYLWPLLWQANRDKVKKPGQLYKGLRLSFPAHPTVEEVAQALAYSKVNNLEGMNQADSQ